MHTWQTFGHEAVKNILDRQLKTGRFAHAYLFQGPEGIGKKTLALEFAKKILGAQRLDNHPDFQILEGAEELTIGQIREFISTVSFRPFVGEKKVSIIDNAHNLNLKSGNALLKTLEEPGDSAVIILISGGGRVLPTIASRCQVFSLQAFSRDKLRQFADVNKITVSEDMETLSFGQPGRLLRLAGDKDFFAQQEKVLDAYRQLLKKRTGEKLLAVAGLGELDVLQLQQEVAVWLQWQWGELSKHPQDFPKLAALSNALTGLQNNQNKKLIMQSLLLRV